jgi:hypothetical protein
MMFSSISPAARPGVPTVDSFLGGLDLEELEHIGVELLRISIRQAAPGSNPPSA